MVWINCETIQLQEVNSLNLQQLATVNHRHNTYTYIRTGVDPGIYKGGELYLGLEATSSRMGVCISTPESISNYRLQLYNTGVIKQK